MRMCNRILRLKRILLNSIATIISSYDPQAGPSNVHDIPLQTTSKTSNNDLIFVAGDVNYHCRIATWYTSLRTSEL